MWFLGVLRGCTLKTSFAGLSFPPAFCDRTITTHPCPCLRFCSQGTQPRERLSPCHRVDPSPSRILRRGNVGTITPLPWPVTPTLGHKGGANHLQREAWLGAGSLQSGTRGFCRYCGPPFVSLQFSAGLGRWWRGGRGGKPSGGRAPQAGAQKCCLEELNLPLLPACQDGGADEPPERDSAPSRAPR